MILRGLGFARPRLLALLHVLLLGSVLLLDLLGLVGVTLFHLLSLRVVEAFPLSLLMVCFLSLL